MLSIPAADVRVQGCTEHTIHWLFSRFSVENECKKNIVMVNTTIARMGLADVGVSCVEKSLRLTCTRPAICKTYVCYLGLVPLSCFRLAILWMSCNVAVFTLL